MKSQPAPEYSAFRVCGRAPIMPRKKVAEQEIHLRGDQEGYGICNNGTATRMYKHLQKTQLDAGTRTTSANKA
ncbi:hypothetical protein KDH_53690 [Dictyobacter sp. S3.2.2.5]|uniref:Uncharacterized protein n=1 Tax=Dictyobacter halimunensis TaxID=3026934 RepID=A0ABQ6FZ67_9CHLR|nr:hypothetical protein KDH_53690 [Dictyobacter sp. S3.2.2.5]